MGSKPRLERGTERRGTADSRSGQLSLGISLRRSTERSRCSWSQGEFFSSSGIHDGALIGMIQEKEEILDGEGIEGSDNL